MKEPSFGQRKPRRRARLIPAALVLLLIVGAVTFAVDLGRVALVRTQLQVAADSAAIAAAAYLGKSPAELIAVGQRYAEHHVVGDRNVDPAVADVQFGVWDANTRTFVPTTEMGNAVRVTCRRNADKGGPAPAFFGALFDTASLRAKASAVAIANPRDIAFVVDLSGSMNDDTEPCWATQTVDEESAHRGRSPVGTELMQQVYDDLGFGPFPGDLEYVGHPWSVGQDEYAYAELTRDDGPLCGPTVPARYRIAAGDSEASRKAKAYSALIDYQIAQVMPNALPAPDSTRNYAYWERYLDYLMAPVCVVSPAPENPTPPTSATPDGALAASAVDRGPLPPNQDNDRITSFNNPNKTAYPSASGSLPRGYRNWIGYRTYVQFMMDYGRDLKPDGTAYVPLSTYSGDCRWHAEATAGGTLQFPPRSQPMHAARRALIAAVQAINERNAAIADSNQRDWVSIVTFDRLENGEAVVRQPLTADYQAAMQACTTLQAAGDKGRANAVEGGLAVARNHIRAKNEGGQGRQGATKVVILLSAGAPQAYVSSDAEISRFIRNHPSRDYYDNGAPACDAALVQAAAMHGDRWSVFPLGIGPAADDDFMDRMARLGGTADDEGQSRRGSDNPARYEQRLSEILREIVSNPQVRLVQ